MIRRFEYIAGGSNKFWEIESYNNSTTITTRWGRRGTKGQELVKSLPSLLAATTLVNKLIQEKIFKGYVELTGSPGERNNAAWRKSVKKDNFDETIILVDFTKKLPDNKLPETDKKPRRRLRL